MKKAFISLLKRFFCSHTLKKPNNMDFKTKSEIRSALDRTRKLIDSKILWDTKSKKVYRKSVLIEVLIHMKDLLIKSEKYLEKRISFKDDVIPDEVLKITDVTDLISNFRDAACHNDSFRREFGSNVMSFNEIVGKGTFMQIGDTIIGSEYEDEIAFNMGQNILYLKRHIEKAFQELESHFKPVVS